MGFNSAFKGLNLQKP